MLATKDIAWIGGLLEGEGSFSISGGSPSIHLSMTDRDTVERAGNILGVPLSTYVHKPKGKATYKDVWKCSVHGYRAAAWMMTLYQFLGNRRRARVRESLNRWREAASLPRGPRGQPLMASCHPDRRRAGRGLCKECYMSQWHAEHAEARRLYGREYMRKWREKRKRSPHASNRLFTVE